MSGQEPAESNTLERIMNERREKAASLRAKGIHPYRNDVGPTISLAAVRERYTASKPEVDGETLRVAGRVMNKRIVGKKLLFWPIRDATGDLQLFINKQNLDPGDYEAVLPHVDAGDIVAAEGPAI